MRGGETALYRHVPPGSLSTSDSNFALRYYGSDTFFADARPAWRVDFYSYRWNGGDVDGLGTAACTTKPDLPLDHSKSLYLLARYPTEMSSP